MPRRTGRPRAWQWQAQLLRCPGQRWTSCEDQLLATSATFAGIAARCCDYLPPDTHQGTTARSLPLCIVITFLEFFGAMVIF